MNIFPYFDYKTQAIVHKAGVIHDKLRAKCLVSFPFLTKLIHSFGELLKQNQRGFSPIARASLPIKHQVFSSALPIAARTGDLAMIKMFAAQGVDLNQRDPAGNTALITAVFWQHIEAVNWFLEQGAFLTLTNSEGLFPLMGAIFRNNSEIAQLLLHKGADVNQTDKLGYTPLLKAVEKGYSDIVTLLLKNNAEPNRSNHEGLTPLFASIHFNFFEIAKKLIEYGADPNKPSSNDCMPLYTATYQKNCEIVQLLLEKGADVNQVNKQGYTPLHLAASAGNVKTIQILIEQGTKIDPIAPNNVTPLLLAAESRHWEVVKQLLRCGANPNIMYKEGVSPLIIAISYNELEIVKELLEYGANSNQICGRDVSPLYMAILENRFEIVKMLLDYRADPNIADQRGVSPFFYAVSLGQLETVKLLIKHGSDPNQVYCETLSPLTIAAAVGNLDMTTLLISAGAEINKFCSFSWTVFSAILKKRNKNWQEITAHMLERQPDALRLHKEISLRKYLAHVSEISGLSPLTPSLSIELQGAFDLSFWKKIAKGLAIFSEKLPDLLAPLPAKFLIDTFNRASLELKVNFENWAAGFPILISTGSLQHIVVVLIWQNHFILCDRGDGGTTQSYKAYRFDQARLNINTLKEIKALSLQARDIANKFMNEELSKRLNFSQTLLERQLEAFLIPKQIMGNCSWASKSGILIALSILHKYYVEKKGSSTDPETFNQIANEQKALFTQWESFQSTLPAQKYLNTLSQPDSFYTPDFNLLSKAIYNNFLKKNIDERIMQHWEIINKNFIHVAPPEMQIKHQVSLKIMKGLSYQSKAEKI